MRRGLLILIGGAVLVWATLRWGWIPVLVAAAVLGGLVLARRRARPPRGHPGDGIGVRPVAGRLNPPAPGA
ncbi:hypothetical protein AB0L25_10635 [Spirillospora sp. NPDC052242]